jgi:hypothetical protein
LNNHLLDASKCADPLLYFLPDHVESRAADKRGQEIDAYPACLDLYVRHDPQVNNAYRHLGIVDGAQHFQDSTFGYHAASGSMR